MSRLPAMIIAGLLPAPTLWSSALAATPINETRPLAARGHEARVQRAVRLGAERSEDPYDDRSVAHARPRRLHERSDRDEHERQADQPTPRTGRMGPHRP